MRKSTLALIALLCVITNFAQASSACKGHFINPITDVCWNCLFPLTIGKSKIVNSDYPDTENPKLPVCSCHADYGDRVGITIGYWEPTAIVDVTKNPYCMVNLGIKLPIKNQSLGGSNFSDVDGRNAFYYVHWYKYPLIHWLQILMSSGCMETEDFDLAYLSELDPQWNDSELSFIENPEAVLFSNPIARASCAVDATTALTKTAIDKLFWCQGSQGSTYPLTGFVAHQASPLQAAVLLVERTDFKLHRFGAIKDSIGEYTPENPAICKPKYSAIMPKSRYRYELVNTIPDAKHCYPFGKSVTTFEAGHVNPKDGDNFGFLVWKKRNCCFL